MRFSKNEDHVLSKEIANLPFAIFVIENLTGIRKQRKGKRMNRRVSNWTFRQFESYLKYKLEERGKRLEYVDARYTSQRCSNCGYIHKSNRNAEHFECKACGHIMDADYNAAINIRDLYLESTNPIPFGQVEVNQPKVLPAYGRDRASSGPRALSN